MSFADIPDSYFASTSRPFQQERDTTPSRCAQLGDLCGRAIHAGIENLSGCARAVAAAVTRCAYAILNALDTLIMQPCRDITASCTERYVAMATFFARRRLSCEREFTVDMENIDKDTIIEFIKALDKQEAATYQVVYQPNQAPQHGFSCIGNEFVIERRLLIGGHTYIETLKGTVKKEEGTTQVVVNREYKRPSTTATILERVDSLAEAGKKASIPSNGPNYITDFCHMYFDRAPEAVLRFSGTVAATANSVSRGMQELGLEVVDSATELIQNVVKTVQNILVSPLAGVAGRHLHRVSILGIDPTTLARLDERTTIDVKQLSHSGYKSRLLRSSMAIELFRRLR